MLELMTPCDFISMKKMPCKHILRSLTQERKEPDGLNYFNQRWLKVSQEDPSDEVIEELNKGSNNFINFKV